LRLRRRNLLKDRRGISNTAVAFLASIIELLIYNAILNMPNGPELLFYLLYLFLRTIGVVGDDFGQFVEWVRSTPVWPLLTLIGAQIGMVLSVAVTFAVTWWTVGITTKILAWRRARREEKRKIREKNDKEYRLWKKRLEGEDEEPLPILPKLTKSSKLKPKVSALNGGISITELEDYKRLLTTEWTQIRKKHVLTLIHGKLTEMFLEAKKLFPSEKSPQGSYKGLARALGMHVRDPRRIIEERRDSITVGNLMKLMDVLKVSYETLTPYIRSVGSSSHKEAIVNPKFPINMENVYGARLLAASLKDGDIRSDSHFLEYTNYNPENRRIVTEAVRHIFGDVEPSPTYDRKGKQNGLCFTSAVIGEVLLKAGAVEGKKTEQDFHLPYMVKFGNSAIGNSYFEQAIRDDGSRDYKRYRISLMGAREIESKVKLDHRAIINHLPKGETTLPSEKKETYIVFSKHLREELPFELRHVYDDLVSKMTDEWVPTIFQEEKEAIERLYGVKAKIKPKQIYMGEKGNLRGKWEIRVQGKEAFSKMVRQLDSAWEEEGDIKG